MELFYIRKPMAISGNVDVEKEGRRRFRGEKAFQRREGVSEERRQAFI